MPIFEYACDDCGTKFEKLVRRAGDAESVRCPACGESHLTTQYSTFAAHSGTAEKSGPICGEGGCGNEMCGGGMCGMNMN